MPTAFDGLFEYADFIANKYKAAEGKGQYKDLFTYLEFLTQYYESLSKSSRLSYAAGYTKKKIYEINKSYAEGYFEIGARSNTKKKKAKPGQAQL